jgi:hypothetical protein
MPEDAFTLFDDYAARFARGEAPDLRGYLTRAGEDAGELGRLVDAFLARASPPDPDEERVALARAWVEGEPPLLELRTRRGLKRDAVVDALVQLLGLDPIKRAKVKRYYHELESGLLEPQRVDRRVWAALAQTLKAQVADLAAWRPRPIEPLGEVYHRREDASLEFALFTARPPEPADEVDRLFRGASD